MLSTSHASIRNAKIHVNPYAVNTPDAKWLITIQFVAVKLVTLAIHSFDASRKKCVIRLFQFNRLVVCQRHADQIHNVVKLVILLFVLACQIISAELQIVDLNALQIRNVRAIWLALMNVALILVSEFVHHKPLAMFTIIKPYVDAQKDSQGIHSLLVLLFQVISNSNRNVVRTATEIFFILVSFVVMIFHSLFDVFCSVALSSVIQTKNAIILVYREPEVTACQANPCGINALCKERNNAGSCSCLPEYYGDPYVECRPECVMNSDCPKTKSCVNQKCVDPCGAGVCSSNAECFVANHSPYCTCLVGYTGNPSIGCYEIPRRMFFFHRILFGFFVGFVRN